MRLAKKFAFDVSYTFIAALILRFSAIPITIFLGRLLGADDLGLYRMVLSIYNLSVLFVGIGIPAAMIKFIAENIEQRDSIKSTYSTCLFSLLLIGVAIVPVFYGLSGVFAETFQMPELEALIKVIAFVFPFWMAYDATLGLLNGLRMMKGYAFGQISQALLMVLLTILFLFLDFGVIGAVYAIVLSYIVTSLMLVYLARSFIQTRIADFVARIKQIAGFGSQIMIANAVNTINYQADVVFVGYFLLAADVGYYAVAASLSRLLWVLPQSVQRITYPSLSEYWAHNDHALFNEVVNKAIQYTACIMTPMVLFVIFYSKDIISLTMGEGFEASVLPLLILLVGGSINAIIQRPIGSILYAIGLPTLNLKIFSSVAILNIILNIMLIPPFGIIGAAFATSITLLLVTALVMYFAQRIAGVQLDLAWFIKLGGIASLSAALFVLAGSYSIATGAIIVAANVILIWTYFLETSDKHYIKSIVDEMTAHLYVWQGIKAMYASMSGMVKKP
ncbi:MAG: flippase [Methanomicrobiaceae archaeon]|nr:flippase [Methanomicrobiaceae archaeon]